MILNSNFSTPQSAAYSVRDAAAIDGTRMTGRPYNRFDPARTNWWLYKDTEWPAYQYAKLFFDDDDALPGSLLCGLYIEKGLGASASAMHQSKSERKWFIQPDWAWHRVTADIRDGKFMPVLDELVKNGGAAPILAMRCNYDIQFSQEPHDRTHDKDGVYTCRFEYKPASQEITFRGTTTPPNNPNTGQLEEILKNVRSLADFAQAPDKFPKKDWIWVDLYIGLNFRLTESTPGDAGKVWDGAETWDKCLKLFMPWIK